MIVLAVGRFAPSVALSASVLALLMTMPEQAWSNQQPMRVYNSRMELLFIRLDSNKDGRLDAGELKGKRALTRRLKRQRNRSYLLIEDLRQSGSSPSGRRLQQHFNRADSDGNKRLDPGEARQIPWIARHFQSLDLDGDGTVTLNELWNRQRSLAPPKRRP